MKSRKELPIGVFDSGLGGLTVVKELTRQLPHENIVYVGDTARVPYGSKSPETVRRYASQISSFLLKQNVKAIVVACNTASALALSSLRRLPIPVLGVIGPGARAAVRGSRQKRIGVIGTPATVSSHAYATAIKKLSRNARVWEKACPLFVPLVEEGWRDHSVTKQVAKEYLGSILKNNVDTLVLGCTHYPLLKKTLIAISGPRVKMIDSAEETAKDVKQMLLEKSALNTSKKKGRAVYFVTDSAPSFSKLGGQFLGKKISPAKRLSFESL